MIARFWHPSRRTATLTRTALGRMCIRLSNGRAFTGVRDTPTNRRHLRTLATDWCAHGISWCGAKTKGGLPKRGVTIDTTSAVWASVWASSEGGGRRDQRDLVFVPEVAGRLLAERAAVREVGRKLLEVLDGKVAS